MMSLNFEENMWWWLGALREAHEITRPETTS